MVCLIFHHLTESDFEILDFLQQSVVEKFRTKVEQIQILEVILYFSSWFKMKSLILSVLMLASHLSYLHRCSHDIGIVNPDA